MLFLIINLLNFIYILPFKSLKLYTNLLSHGIFFNI
jgi:hypothetical protein